MWIYLTYVTYKLQPTQEFRKFLSYLQTQQAKDSFTAELWIHIAYSLIQIQIPD